MLGGSSSKKDAFLASTKAARDRRSAERQREAAAVKIQAAVRGWLDRVRVRKRVLADFDATFPPVGPDVPEAAMALPSASEAYSAARRLLAFCDPGGRDHELLERLCRYVLASLSDSSPRTSYVSAALSKSSSSSPVAWISHLRRLLLLCAGRIDALHSLDSPLEARDLSTLLRMLVSFTSTSGWALLKVRAMERLSTGMNQLCSNVMGHLVQAGFMGHLKRLLLRGLCVGARPVLKKTTVAAVVTLTIRPVASAEYSDKLVSIYLINIMCVPGLITHLSNLSSESLALLQKHEILQHSVKLLASEQQLKIHFNSLEGSYALCLTANLIHLISLLTEEEFANVDFLSLVFVLTRLLECCGQYVTSKQSNASHWHPVLGWFSVRLDNYLQDSMEVVKSQLARLWSPQCIKILSKPLMDAVEKLPALPPPPNPEPPSSPTSGVSFAIAAASSGASGGTKQFFRKALEKTRTAAAAASAAASSATSNSTTSAPRGGYLKMGSPEVMKIALMCNLFQHALKTLAQLNMEILAGLCYKNILMAPLWRLVQSFGPNCGLKAFLDHLTSVNSKSTAPEFQILILFSNCLAYVVTILDDLEMYERQTPFTLAQYAQIGAFANSFLYRAVSAGLLLDPRGQLFSSVHSLLMVLYARDNRRPYARPGHWLVKEVKVRIMDQEACSVLHVLNCTTSLRYLPSSPTWTRGSVRPCF